MTTTDWVLDLALIAIVLRQIREERLTARFFILPLAIVGWAGSKYLTGVPAAGNNRLLVGALVAVGLLLGIGSGLATHLRVKDGALHVRAGFVAAGLWVLGAGSRLAFQVWATHGGGTALTHWSTSHDITTASVYATALVGLALTEVISRMTTIGIRAWLTSRRAATELQTPVAPRELVHS